MRENVRTITYSHSLFCDTVAEHQYLLTLGGSSSDAVLLFAKHILQFLFNLLMSKSDPLTPD
jgi:hypothetical protein